MMSYTNVTIREVTQNDHDLESILEQVALIWTDAQKSVFLPMIQRVNPALFESLYSDPEFLSMERLRKAFTCTVRNFYKLAIACNEERVLGYILFIPVTFSDESEEFLNRVFSGHGDDLSVADRTEFKNYVSTDQLYVEELMVDSSAQRSGIGTLLMEYVLNYGHNHGFSQCVVTTPEHNENACKFYEKQGFSKLKTFLNKDDLSIVAFQKSISS